jgi:hypothetical protein
MRIHFIAIGGAAMHNLAIALKIKKYHITGSDDIINDPSKTRLKDYKLYPSELGGIKIVLLKNLTLLCLECMLERIIQNF